jgi:hypothetical protein
MKSVDWKHLFFPLDPPLAARMRSAVAILRPRTVCSDFDGCSHIRLDGQSGYPPDAMEWVEFVPDSSSTDQRAQ